MFRARLSLLGRQRRGPVAGHGPGHFVQRFGAGRVRRRGVAQRAGVGGEGTSTTESASPLQGRVRNTEAMPQSRWQFLCVPKRNPIVLASFMIEPQYTYANSNENNKNHEDIHRIEENQGV